MCGARATQPSSFLLSESAAGESPALNRLYQAETRKNRVMVAGEVLSTTILPSTMR